MILILITCISIIGWSTLSFFTDKKVAERIEFEIGPVVMKNE